MLVPLEQSDNEFLSLCLSVSACACLFSAALDLNKPARRTAFAHQGSLGRPLGGTRVRSRGRIVVVAPCRYQNDMHAHIEKLVRLPRFQLLTQQTERAEAERGTGFRVLSRST